MTKKIEQELEDAKKKESDLKTQLDESAETLAKMKADYEDAVRTGAGEAKLDKLDGELFKSDRGRVRLEIRLQQVCAEIDALQKEKVAALAFEREQEFLKLFDELADRLVMFEMALTEFLSRKKEIDDSIRAFMNAAATSGRDIQRLRIVENMKLQVTERLYPTLTSKWQDRREQFTAPLADILEQHIRIVLDIPQCGAPANERSVVEQEAEHAIT